MSKKVLILSSSPRRNGNSDLLCNEFMRGAAEAGHQVEKIFLKDKHINYCTGCSVCSMYGKPCPQKDDAAEVVEKMIARRHRHGNPRLLLHHERADEDTD